MNSEDTKNKTEGKKNKYCSDIIDCIDKYLSIFVKVLATLGVSASLLATISLIYYAYEEKVNIFSHYSSWFSVLPIIATTVILIGGLITALAFIPSVIIYVFLFDKKLMNGKKEALRSNDRIKQFPLIYAFSVVLPTIVVATNFEPESIRIDYFLSWVFVCSLVNTGILMYIERNKCLGVLNCSTLFFTFFLLAFIGISLALFAAYILLIPFSFKLWDVIALIDLIAIGMMLPIVYHFREKVAYSGFLVSSIFVIGLLILLITPVSGKISGAALRAWNMGGGVERVYHISRHDLSRIPKQIIDWNCCVKDFCITKMLSIKWEGRNLTYASLKKKTGQSIALPGSILLPYNLYTETGMPENCETQQELKDSATNKRN